MSGSKKKIPVLGLEIKKPLRNFSGLSPACQLTFYSDPKPTVQGAQYRGHELETMHFFYREAEEKTY